MSNPSIYLAISLDLALLDNEYDYSHHFFLCLGVVSYFSIFRMKISITMSIQMDDKPLIIPKLFSYLIQEGVFKSRHRLA